MEAATLRTLLGREELHLRLVTPEAGLPDGALDRALRWVHSSDLHDPTPFLADDLALLTTGSQFAQRGPGSQIEYVARLARRGIAGLGFGTGVTLPEVPRPLVQACADNGIPLFEVPYHTPFLAVARAHGELAADPSARLGEQSRMLRARLLTSLMHDDSTLAAAVWGKLPEEPILVAIAENVDGLDDWWSDSPEAFTAETDEGYAVCLSTKDARLLDDAAAQYGIRVGVSCPVSYAQFSRGAAEARSALARSDSGTNYFGRAAGNLVAMVSHEDARVVASALLAPLDSTNLAHTLRVWLSHNAKVTDAAVELGVHRHTLRSRLSRASTLLDRDLSTFSARAELWTALHARDLPADASDR